MRERMGLGGIVLLLLLSQCALPFFISAERLHASWSEEIVSVRETFGTTLGDRVVQAGQRAAALSVPGPSGPMPGPTAGGGRTLDRRDALVIRASQLLVRHIQDYVEALRLRWRMIVLRLVVLGVWTLQLSPLLIACVVDGLVQRQVTLASLGFQNPIAFALAQRGLFLASLLSFVYVGLPFAIPAMLVPLAVLMWAPLLCLLLRHLQPVFTR